MSGVFTCLNCKGERVPGTIHICPSAASPRIRTAIILDNTDGTATLLCNLCYEQGVIRHADHHLCISCTACCCGEHIVVFHFETLDLDDQICTACFTFTQTHGGKLPFEVG